MVLRDEESLNTLFDELARWNSILEAEKIDWDAIQAPDDLDL